MAGSSQLLPETMKSWVVVKTILAVYEKIPTLLPFRRRPIPGLDFCGEVVALGPSAAAVAAANGLEVGTVVCGAIPASSIAIGVGSFVQYLAVAADILVPKPVNLSEPESAGLGIAGQTAVLVMKEAAIEPGNRVLINGASGGVGTLLCQMVAAQGGRVTAICSGPNAGLVKRLGAVEVIDYTLNSPVYYHLETEYGDNPFDVIIDCVGNQFLYDMCEAYLKPTGIFLNIVGGASEGYKILALMPSGQLQREIVRYVNEGLVKEVVIDSEYEYADAIKAYEKLETKRAKGKIILKVAV
ncbi:unnamed protein product [Parascedosporium putredinis]|uniref:Enoyl reductase (ER) domain-containing protein n=1 Tax=Parascedosporium putredinis TaxID=1442378 RepID=A0A9P1GWP1_9PEZI|nr:unnamed protein product [Parascedosporium putredinis]CAI7989043.1 unnamed protein product [Parascedosporium putredinis]